MDISSNDLDRSHRTGPMERPKRNSSQHVKGSSSLISSESLPINSQSRHRPILVKFATYRARQAVLRARRKLKNSGISIAEDLTFSNYKLLRAAREANKATAAWSQDGRIFVALPASNGKTAKKLITSVEDLKKL